MAGDDLMAHELANTMERIERDLSVAASRLLTIVALLGAILAVLIVVAVKL